MCNMKSTELILGPFEHDIMMAVFRLKTDAYANGVKKELRKRSGEFSLGAIGTTMARLQDKGLLESRLAEETPDRGGRRKRIYWLTAKGASALNKTRQRQNRWWEDVVEVLP